MPLRVALFSGGSGTASLSTELASRKDVELTVLVNCYDDGKSTGQLRRFVPGMLGPSDIRKNIARLSNHPELEDRQRWIVKEKAAIDWMKEFFAYRMRFTSDLSDKQIDVYLGDCPSGNVLFTGAYLKTKDFNAAVDAMQAVYRTKARILNVTDGTNLWLKVRGSDGRMYQEGDLVAMSSDVRCMHICFEATKGVYRAPVLNDCARHALTQAEVIVYGPGTQFSSLLPSYLTDGIGDAIAGNTKALKVWIGNLTKDTDIKNETVHSLQDRMWRALASTSTHATAWEDFVDRSLLHMGELSTEDPLGTYQLDDWSLGAVHNGEKVVKAIFSML